MSFVYFRLFVGQIDKAKKVLCSLRGTDAVDVELNAIIISCQMNASHGKFYIFVVIHMSLLLLFLHFLVTQGPNFEALSTHCLLYILSL